MVSWTVRGKTHTTPKILFLVALEKIPCVAVKEYSKFEQLWGKQQLLCNNNITWAVYNTNNYTN